QQPCLRIELTHTYTVSPPSNYLPKPPPGSLPRSPWARWLTSCPASNVGPSPAGQNSESVVLHASAVQFHARQSRAPRKNRVPQHGFAQRGKCQKGGCQPALGQYLETVPLLPL